MSKPKVIAVITEEAPYQKSYKHMLMRILSQTPSYGAIRTALPGLVKAYRLWSYRKRKEDPSYSQHIEKHNGYWLLYKDIREARRYFSAQADRKE